MGWVVIVHWKEDCIPSMNLGKEKKFELFGEYEQTFSAFVFCLLYLHMNISTHVVKFRHGCFHVTFSCLHTERAPKPREEIFWNTANCILA